MGKTERAMGAATENKSQRIKKRYNATKGIVPFLLF